MNPEKLLEHAEAVRLACHADRKLRKVQAKVSRGHDNLRPMAKRLASRIDAVVEVRRNAA
jgi:hypothetical protein